MEYKLKKLDKTLVVTPYNGDSFDYDRDFVFFIQFALDHGYTRVNFCKSSISLQNQSSELRQHENTIFIKNNILESYKIVKNKENGKTLIFRDGLKVFTKPTMLDVYESLEKQGYFITNDFSFAKSFSTVYFNKNYIIIFSEDDLWFSNDIIKIGDFQFKRDNGVIVRGGSN